MHLDSALAQFLSALMFRNEADFRSFYRCWVIAGQSPASVWGMVKQVWHLSWTEKGNPCRPRVERRDKGGGWEWREVRPLRGNVILPSSVPHTYTGTHTGMLCRCAGWCAHAKDECPRSKKKKTETFSVCICVSANTLTHKLITPSMMMYNNAHFWSEWNGRISLISHFIAWHRKQTFIFLSPEYWRVTEKWWAKKYKPAD